MATKKPSRLQNLSARPGSPDDTIDEQLVDASGVFRVTSAIAQAQAGDEPAGRFSAASLTMPAQGDVLYDAPESDEPVEDQVIESEAASAAKRQRLATLAARSARQQPRRR